MNDNEIKDWIDRQSVITRIELSRFIYGYKKLDSRKLDKWWLYVLETKNLTKLREYAREKEKAGTNSFLIKIKHNAK